MIRQTGNDFLKFLYYIILYYFTVQLVTQLQHISVNLRCTTPATKTASATQPSPRLYVINQTEQRTSLSATLDV